MINKMDELHQIETAWLRLYISVESENLFEQHIRATIRGEKRVSKRGHFLRLEYLRFIIPTIILQSNAFLVMICTCTYLAAIYQVIVN